MKTDTLLDSYKGQYMTFCQSLAQTQMLCMVATQSLGNFPQSLPEPLRTETNRVFLSLLETLNAFVSPDESDGKPWAAIQSEKNKISGSGESTGKFARQAVEWLISTFPIEKNSENVFSTSGHAFRTAARHQAVGMTLAHLDAFLTDSIKVICLACPSVLKTKKELTWETAMGFTSITELQEHLTLEFVAEFSRQGIVKRIETLDAKLGIRTQMTQDDWAILRLYEQRRHLIIHGGGLVTDQYIRSSGDNDTPIGSLVKVDNRELDNLAHVVKMLASDLFSAIAVKFLKTGEDKINGVWRRSKRRRDTSAANEFT